MWLIDNIIDSFKGGKNVPIGNYTSQWFGNFYLTPLDYYIKQELKIKDYIRYCDDFLLFGNDKKYLGECAKKVKDFCRDELKMTLSKCDLFPVSRGVDFLGYRHFPKGYILLRKSTAKRVFKRIKNISKCKNKDTFDCFKARSQIASTLGWIKHANTYNARKKIQLEELSFQITTMCKGVVEGAVI